MIAFRAASPADYAALCPQRGAGMWRAAAVQVLSGAAWCLWHGDRRLMLCGLAPLPGGALEGWLIVGAARPPAPALRHLLDRARAVCPDRPIIVRIDDGNAAGRKMALLAGFAPTAETIDGSTIRTWRRPPLDHAGGPET